MQTSVKYEKLISSLGHYDVAVLGGGPSGVCAAVEAARNCADRKYGNAWRNGNKRYGRTFYDLL